MPLLEQLLEKYPKEIKIVHKHFPLRNHKFAFQAAAASVAADNQGKFWPFQDMIFENYNKLSDKKLIEFAKKAELDIAQFEKDRKSPATAAKVNRDLEDGLKAEVRGTPTLFINGRVPRDRSLNGLSVIIDKELGRSGGT